MLDANAKKPISTCVAVVTVQISLPEKFGPLLVIGVQAVMFAPSEIAIKVFYLGFDLARL